LLKTLMPGWHQVFRQHYCVSVALRVLGLANDDSEAKARAYERYKRLFDPNREGVNPRRNLRNSLLAELGRIGMMLPESHWGVVREIADDAIKLLKQGHTRKQVEAHLKGCRMRVKAVIRETEPA
jgi:hypothetical protein